MRSSVPCSSWIDSFSLLDIQVVSLKRDYYVSLGCQVDFVRNNPSRKTPQALAVRGLRNHTTMEINLSRIHMVSGLVLERMWMTKAVQRIVMSLSCSRLGDRKTGRIFMTRNGTPLVHGNINRYVLKPICKKLGMKPATTH